MDPTDGTRRSYDAVADDYAREIAGESRGKPLDRAVLDVFAETVPTGPVADLGCGPGHVAAHLRAGGLPVVGLDLSPAMCAVAGRDARVPVASGDLTALPIRSDSLAGAVCLYTVIHLDPQRRAVAYGELARVLRPGGLALVAFHVEDADIAPGGCGRCRRGGATTSTWPSASWTPPPRSPRWAGRAWRPSRGSSGSPTPAWSTRVDGARCWPNGADGRGRVLR